MFRTLISLAFAAAMGLAGLAASTAPSAAGHRDRVHFGVGIGFGSGYVQFDSAPRYTYYPSRYRYPRFGHGRYYDPYRGYYYNPYRYRYGSVYRRRAPVIYHQPRVRYRSGGAHIEWCYARYRSYRAYDNTFQPYHGPRRQCWSPYS